jgi:glucosamine--fructose-6-phosphate aminotransferase (isomerizing)
MTDSYTWHEISSQPETWNATLESFSSSRSALESFLSHVTFDRLLVIGCGSTYYLAQAAAAGLNHHTSFPGLALPSSELWLYPDIARHGRPLLLTVSRSGKTSETLHALDHFVDTVGGPTLAITCYPEEQLAHRADFSLMAPAAQEESVAQTRSFTSMFLLSQALTAVLARDEGMLDRLKQLPEALENLVDRLGDLPQALGEDFSIRRMYFVGGGPLYGLANEAMLKTKEMSLSQAETFHPLEIRHGPMSMVDKQTLIIGFLSSSGLAQEIHVLRDMRALGARVLALVEDRSVFRDWNPDYVIELRSGLDDWGRGALYLPPIQRLAFHRAVAQGLNPDRPTNLTAVVEL